MKRAIVILLTLSALICRAETQPADLNNVEVPKFWDMITNLPEDWALWADGTFAKENYGNLLGITLLTAVTVATDYETWKESERWADSSEDLREIHIKFVGGGDGYFHFTTALAFAGWGYYGGNNRALRTSSQIVEAMLATGALVQIMKHVTGRQSPFKSTDTRTGRWELFPEQVKYTQNVQNYDAVPSGHIATAYSTFYVIKENFPEHKWISWVGYPAVAMIAQGLVGTGIHWWSDIPLGIALGHGFAKIVVSRNKKNTEPETGFWGGKLMPVVTNDRTLLGVTWEW